MNFKPNKGLFRFDFNDQHAIIGVAVDSDATIIRNRYKEIARLLHPDSSRWTTNAERDLAIKLFSNLITHAYGNLSRASVLKEQQMMLELMGKRLVAEASKIEFSGSAAQQLLQKNSNDLQQSYDQLLQELAQQQYRQLDQSIEITGQISELNMVYLLRKQNQSIRSAPISATDTSPSVSFAEPALPKPAPAKTVDSAAIAAQQNSMRRAEEYLNMRNWAKANVELREVLKGDPNNVQAHAHLAIVYSRQNQATMAKMHMNKAMQLGPNDPIVKTAQQEFQKMSSSPSVSPGTKTATGQNKGGLFGLFGKK
jgi:tetratricopeptide (TPR) repeat protein